MVEITNSSIDQPSSYRCCFSFEAAQLETSYLVAYRHGDCGIEIGLLERHFPTLELRKRLPVNRSGESSTYATYTLPKLPAELPQSDAPLRPLGKGFFASGGSSCERTALFAMNNSALARSNDILTFVPIQEIRRRYRSGEPLDIKIVLAALRLEEPPTQRLSSAKLTIPTNWIIPVGSSELLADLHSQWSSSSNQRPIRTSVIETTTPPAEPFLNQLEFEHGGGQAVVRRGFDGVDSGAYVRVADDIYMLIKRGIRPMLVARELVAGDTGENACPLAIEGISESLEGEQNLDDIAQRAMQGVREEGGVEPLGVDYLGSLFPLLDRHVERVDSFLVQIDPSRAVSAHYTPDERVDSFLVPVRDVIDLCNHGVITDPRLEINARFLAEIAGKPRYSDRD